MAQNHRPTSVTIQPDAADTVVVNAHLPTVGVDGSSGDGASAVAIASGRIVATGGAEVERLADSATTVIDLGGRTLLPGINDSHFHVAGAAMNAPPLSLDASSEVATSTRQLAEVVAAAAAGRPPGTWIRGRGWRASELSDVAEGDMPDSALLDQLVPDHPVILTDFSGHAILTNAAAQRMAGVTASTTLPSTGSGFRRADGTWTGVFVEGAQAVFWHVVPGPSDAELAAALGALVTRLHRLGITSVTDAALNPLASESGVGGGRRVYELLRNSVGPNGLRLRVSALLAFSPLGTSELGSTEQGLAALDDAAFELSGNGPEWFNVRGIKLFADGVPPNHTSVMSRPYPSGHCGCLTVGGSTEDEQLRELAGLVRVGHDRGMQVGVHVTGDRGAELVVDAMAAALDGLERHDPRHYLIHGPLTPPATLALAASRGIGVNVQPTLKRGAGPAMEVLIGEDLTAYQWPLRTMIDSGCMMAASSDSPVTTPDWRVGVQTAVERRTSTGDVSGAGERISVGEALAAYTAAGAWQDGAESWKGQIAPGHVADLCVVDGRLDSDPVDRLTGADVSLTMVGGEVVHDTLS